MSLFRWASLRLGEIIPHAASAAERARMPHPWAKYDSVSHLYNLKKTRVYASKSLFYTKTNPVQRDIGIRRKPEPFGKPGYIRVDSVHQGDLDKEKGVYHINLVDEVTQTEYVGCVEGISEYFLLPLLDELLRMFPLHVIEFHSDNGSEYINRQVAEM
ncbi:MAG: hypothetical protein B7Z73_16570, partial [Planctomycetia bacterium 21-64-5]